jgi:hypothetical protein
VNISCGDSGNSYINTINVGYTKAQTTASNYIGTYPANNQTGVALSMSPETPSPFAGLATVNDFATHTGYPLTVLAPGGSTLKATSFTVTAAGAASSMPTQLFTTADANLASYTNQVMLVPTQPMLPSTVYTASFVGTVTFNGVTSAVTQNWSFTTSGN